MARDLTGSGLTTFLSCISTTPPFPFPHKSSRCPSSRASRLISIGGVGSIVKPSDKSRFSQTGGEDGEGHGGVAGEDEGSYLTLSKSTIVAAPEEIPYGLAHLTAPQPSTSSQTRSATHLIPSPLLARPPSSPTRGRRCSCAVSPQRPPISTTHRCPGPPSKPPIPIFGDPPYQKTLSSSPASSHP
jgi:hypothetical protein